MSSLFRARRPNSSAASKAPPAANTCQCGRDSPIKFAKSASTAPDTKATGGTNEAATAGCSNTRTAITPVASVAAGPSQPFVGIEAAKPKGTVHKYATTWAWICSPQYHNIKASGSATSDTTAQAPVALALTGHTYVWCSGSKAPPGRFTTRRYVPSNNRTARRASPPMFLASPRSQFKSAATSSAPMRTAAATTTGTAATFAAGPLRKRKDARSHSAARRRRALGAPPSAPRNPSRVLASFASASNPLDGAPSTSPGALVGASSSSPRATRDSSPRTRAQPAATTASSQEPRGFRPATTQSEVIGKTMSTINGWPNRTAHSSARTKTTTTAPI